MGAVILQHLDFTEGSLGSRGASTSYLNCIPLSRYREYCDISSVRILIDSDREVIIRIRQLFLDGSVVEEEKTVDGHSEFCIDTCDLILLESVEPSCAIKGTVEAYAEMKRTVSLEHVVCTYRREETVLLKANMFSSAGLQNYHMTIVDNGSTLDDIDDPLVTIIRSPNLGGSSGFTRGIVSGLERGCTHILLNDDDAYISPETVFRLIQFLSLISEDYADCTIAGVFLDVQNPNIIHETGGHYENGLLQLCSEGEDVRTDKGLISIISETRANYSAWTCCCIPSSVIQRSGLPLPLFVRMDDIEYGLRIKKEILAIPGISVWHPTSVRYPLRYCYYDVRNSLSVLSCSDGLDRGAVDNIIKMILSEIAAYRYDCAEEMLKGIYDFMKGPDYVFNNCKEGMHKVANVYQERSDDLRKTLKKKRKNPEVSRKVRSLTMNGLFLPSLGDIELQRCETETKYYYRVGRVLYTSNDGMGVLRSRSLLQSIRLTMKVLAAKRKIVRNIQKLNSIYSSSKEQYTSLEQWRKMWDEC